MSISMLTIYKKIGLKVIFDDGYKLIYIDTKINNLDVKYIFNTKTGMYSRNINDCCYINSYSLNKINKTKSRNGRKYSIRTREYSLEIQMLNALSNIINYRTKRIFN